MKTYKWQLRKGSRKEICPNCGKKRFVPYVLSADGVTLAGGEFGRCDREQSCGYQRYPDGERYTVATPVKIQPRIRLEYANDDLHISTDSNLFEWARSILGISDAVLAWSDYNVGCIGGRVIWWQIDREGVVRTGKVMSYLPNGHRDKSDQWGVTWAHKHPQLKSLFKGEELQQCLFGEHLLKACPNKPVALVESEKTAVIMSRFIPEYVWLATGGSQGIKSNERLAALSGRKVLLVPDNGQYYAWKRTAELYGWEIWDGLEHDAPFEGADILDIVEQTQKTIQDEKSIF
jgi:hypothetical protein